MFSPITSRPPLDDFDVSTIRQLYSEAQNWSRHYEQLIVNANMLIISACLIFVGLAFGDKVTARQAFALLTIPFVMGGLGIVLTETLFNLYATCIKRMIRLENLLGCFSESKFQTIDGNGPLLPLDLASLPIRRPTSVRFFLGIHVFLAVSYLLIAGLKWL